MSLTSRLDVAGDPIRVFMRDRFPHTKGLIQDIRAVSADDATIRPEGTVPWPLLGHAIDFRIRGYFAPVTFTEGTILGLINSWDVRLIDPMVIEDIITELDGYAASLASPGRRLGVKDERWLARFCLVLAMCEVFYRSRHSDEHLLALDPDDLSATGLLDLAQDEWIDDLCALSWAFHDVSTHDLRSPVTLNPTFAGSADVGGADADLIMDGCLTEIKATIDPKKNRPKWLYQLLGYLLLDYRDEYRIRCLGFYLARQRRYIHWTVEDFLTVLSGGSIPPLDVLRSEFGKAARTRPSHPFAASNE